MFSIQDKPYNDHGAFCSRPTPNDTVASMRIGSVIGAIIGGMLAGMVPASVLKFALEVTLNISAF
ncbi:hypothetical protein Q2T42_21920 [Leptolyngbya boryana CZ1]|uniref:Uncharacterized protein n=1 Tax=Leptolyngbya boryana CZ1 TaxID=3060204 RepID=A0AA96WR17_LEPBY|nr:hypothetical protein [Leptolyngbya boryana]WNZ44461.1 hypothetical protein Q2T42_21920 [Leptolyngbya boryana CZ1]